MNDRSNAYEAKRASVASPTAVALANAPGELANGACPLPTSNWRGIRARSTSGRPADASATGL